MDQEQPRRGDGFLNENGEYHHHELPPSYGGNYGMSTVDDHEAAPPPKKGVFQKVTDTLKEKLSGNKPRDDQPGVPHQHGNGSAMADPHPPHSEEDDDHANVGCMDKLKNVVTKGQKPSHETAPAREGDSPPLQDGDGDMKAEIAAVGADERHDHGEVAAEALHSKPNVRFQEDADVVQAGDSGIQLQTLKYNQDSISSGGSLNPESDHMTSAHGYHHHHHQDALPSAHQLSNPEMIKPETHGMHSPHPGAAMVSRDDNQSDGGDFRPDPSVQQRQQDRSHLPDQTAMPPPGAQAVQSSFPVGQKPTPAIAHSLPEEDKKVAPPISPAGASHSFPEDDQISAHDRFLNELSHQHQQGQVILPDPQERQKRAGHEQGELHVPQNEMTNPSSCLHDPSAKAYPQRDHPLEQRDRQQYPAVMPTQHPFRETQELTNQVHDDHKIPVSDVDPNLRGNYSLQNDQMVPNTDHSSINPATGQQHLVTNQQSPAQNGSSSMEMEPQENILQHDQQIPSSMQNPPHHHHSQYQQTPPHAQYTSTDNALHQPPAPGQLDSSDTRQLDHQPNQVYPSHTSAPAVSGHDQYPHSLSSIQPQDNQKNQLNTPSQYDAASPTNNLNQSIMKQHQDDPSISGNLQNHQPNQEINPSKEYSQSPIDPPKQVKDPLDVSNPQGTHLHSQPQEHPNQFYSPNSAGLTAPDASQGMKNSDSSINAGRGPSEFMSGWPQPVHPSVYTDEVSSGKGTKKGGFVAKVKEKLMG